MDLVEINEAFAPQYCACEKAMGLNREVTNVNGGAIALGHPLGATGAILTMKVIYELRRQNKKWGKIFFNTTVIFFFTATLLILMSFHLV